MTAYLEHFKLREPPFRIAPDAAPFFGGGSFGATLDAVHAALSDGSPVLEIVGAPGSGKTTLCHTLAADYARRADSLLLNAPALTRRQLLTGLAGTLEVSAQTADDEALRRTVHDALSARQAAKKPLVLLIDDAHAASDDVLEEIQRLTDFGAGSGSALRVVVAGRPELRERLDTPARQSLREQITRHLELEPLARDEVTAYIDWRLGHAGLPASGLFSQAAISQLASASDGLVRRINVLADKALQAAASAGKVRVDTDDVRAAIQDTRSVSGPATLGHQHRTKIWAAVAAGVGVIALAALSGRVWHPEGASPKPAAIQPAQPPASAPLKPLQPQVRTAKIRFGPLTRQHMAQFDDWIDEAPGSHYFIQLLATDATRTGHIEGFVARAIEQLDPAQIRAYRSSLSGHDRVGVIYGDFATREEAIAAMQQLPDTIKAAQPFPRQVARLR